MSEVLFDLVKCIGEHMQPFFFFLRQEEWLFDPMESEQRVTLVKRG